MYATEIRARFLKYFERHGHAVRPSSSLVPGDDPTLLFTNAGMVQFKKVFLGMEQTDYGRRAVTSQKCVRAGGKHNDLEQVGHTYRHHTFFEMLGNFSFGDYFKRDAIRFAWEWVTGPREEGNLGFPKEHIRISVFREDDEARALWREVAGLPDSRIYGLGEKDNFWQMADTGPCGPCSEIFIDLAHVAPDYRIPEGATGEWTELDRKEFSLEAFIEGGDRGRFLEFWNLVFMQFERTRNDAGEIVQTALPKPSVDTGAGLERIAAILQGVTSNYDTDLIRPIIEFTAQLADRHYEPETTEGFAMRVIADHARATAFSIADSILPGNEGRNYVLRKIMRRAIYHGRHALGFDEQFFYKVTNFVVDQMLEAYPELEASRDFIERMVKLEEERFGTTLTVGLQKLDELLSRTPEGSLPAFTDLARLYDTYGTPRDLIRVGLEERGFALGEEDFARSFDAALKEIQRTAEREATETAGKIRPIYGETSERSSNEFTGYAGTRIDDAKVVSIIRGEREVAELAAGEEGEVVLDRSPFYAESGGQVGDTGALATGNTHAVVKDTQSPVTGLIVHYVNVESGLLRTGDTVVAQVDAERRDAIRRNHTATHLLHAALREVLGGHVK